MLLLLPRHRTHFVDTSGVGSRKTRLVLVALVVGLPKIGRYLVLLIMCRQKNRWCWYSLITGRGATNTGGAGIPNTSQQAYPVLTGRD